jgi:hypothetical protein
MDEIVRLVFEDGLTRATVETVMNAVMGLGVESSELANGEEAHPSNVALRTRQGGCVRFRWRLTLDERREASVLAKTARGRFSVQMHNHLGDLKLGRLTAKEATARGHAAIEEYYEQIFRHGMQAAGNPAVILSPHDKSALSRIVRDERDYWTGFMEDVEDGRGHMDYEESRDTCLTTARRCTGRRQQEGAGNHRGPPEDAGRAPARPRCPARS